MKFNLVVLSEGNAEGKAIPITLPQFLIGRDRQCHLRPVSTLISKRHCALLLQEGRAFIRDLNSTNGTLLNDEQIQGEHELNDGDMVKVGPLSFRIQLELPTPVDKPTPPPGKALGDITGGQEVEETMAMEKVAAAQDMAEVQADVEEFVEQDLDPAATNADIELDDAVVSLDDEESIAALLMDDDGTTHATEGSEEEVDEDTTMMEMMLPPDMLEEKKQEAAAKKETDEKQKSANTSSAAADILNQMYRRR